MGGLQPSDLIVRPGMGKTSLVTNIATNAALAYEHDVHANGSPNSLEDGVVGFFSLEMSSEQLAKRIVSVAKSLRWTLPISQSAPMRCPSCRSILMKQVVFQF